MAVTLPALEPLHRLSAKRTWRVFAADADAGLDIDGTRYVCASVLLYTTNGQLASPRIKLRDEYWSSPQLPPALLAQQQQQGPVAPVRKLIAYDPSTAQQASSTSLSTGLSQALTLHKTSRTLKPIFHSQWKLVRVISGHLGWVRSVAVEPGNTWFATGAGDRVIKIWDLASGELKLSLTGHISTVRGLAVSTRHPYLFSCAEDKVSPSPDPSFQLAHSSDRWSNAGIWKPTRLSGTTTATSREYTRLPFTQLWTFWSPPAEMHLPVYGTCALKLKYTSWRAIRPL